MKAKSALAAGGVLSLLLCAQSAPSGCLQTQAIVANALAYACPIALGVQVSTLKLTATESTIINEAVADCAQWQANPNVVFTSPQTVASILIQAAELLQANAYVPLDTKEKIVRAELRLKLDLRNLKAL